MQIRTFFFLTIVAMALVGCGAASSTGQSASAPVAVTVEATQAVPAANDATSAAAATSEPTARATVEVGMSQDSTAEPTQENAAAATPQGAATAAAGPNDPVSGPLTTVAKQMLARDTGVAEADITVKSVDAVEWRNSSLGCPKNGVMYMQVITPGYRIVLSAQGTDYNFHTDMNDRVVKCERPETPAAPGSAQ